MPVPTDGHTVVVSIFGEMTPTGFSDEGSIAAGGPFYTCTECGGRVMLLTTERGTDEFVHVAGPGDPDFEVVHVS